MKQLAAHFTGTITQADGDTVNLRSFDSLAELEAVLTEGMEPGDTAVIHTVWSIVEVAAPAAVPAADPLI